MSSWRPQRRSLGGSDIWGEARECSQVRVSSQPRVSACPHLSPSLHPHSGLLSSLPASSRLPHGPRGVFLHQGLALLLPCSQPARGSLTPPRQSGCPSAHLKPCMVHAASPPATLLFRELAKFSPASGPVCKLFHLLAHCPLPLHLVNDNQPFKSLIRWHFYQGDKALPSCHLLSQQPWVCSFPSTGGLWGQRLWGMQSRAH